MLLTKMLAFFINVEDFYENICGGLYAKSLIFHKD
jgi:hypothetical protein